MLLTTAQETIHLTFATHFIKTIRMKIEEQIIILDQPVKAFF